MNAERYGNGGPSSSATCPVMPSPCPSHAMRYVLTTVAVSKRWAELENNEDVFNKTFQLHSFLFFFPVCTVQFMLERSPLNKYCTFIFGFKALDCNLGHHSSCFYVRVYNILVKKKITRGRSNTSSLLGPKIEEKNHNEWSQSSIFMI